MWIKKLISMVLVTYFGVRDSSAAGECGKFPEKNPAECCDGYVKIFPESLFVKCEDECKSSKDDNHCCASYCGAKELGLLKDDKVDSETAIASLQKLAGDDKEWEEAINKAVEECSNPDLPYLQKRGPKDSECATFEIGAFTMCIYIQLTFKCPKPIDDEDCKETHEYNKCFATKLAEHGKKNKQN